MKTTSMISSHRIVYQGVQEFCPKSYRHQVVNHKAIYLAYNEDTEQAVWVSYLLTKQHLKNGICKRKDRFKVDPNIITKSASPKDYYKSGYDRGHLAPAADMLWNEEAMLESFYMSNMSPQNPSFNRGAWKKLESFARKLAIEEDSIIIITGPIFIDSIDAIGSNNVHVPSHFYKIIVDISSPNIGAIAFIMPNRHTKLPLNKFAVSIDSVESVTKMDFMQSLPDDLELQLECEVNKSILVQLTN